MWTNMVAMRPRGPVEDSTLFVDSIHVKADENVKPLIGSAKLPLRKIPYNVGLGALSVHKLKLKRPSNRPQGKLEVKVTIQLHLNYTITYMPFPPNPNITKAGYNYNQPSYDQGQYGSGGSYGNSSLEKLKEKSKLGVRTRVVVGSIAGVLGGLAIAEGVDYLEDKVADDAAEKVEEDLGYDD